MTEITLARGLSLELADYVIASGAHIATVDIDQVMTDYGSNHVYPEAETFVKTLRNAGVLAIGITNTVHTTRLAGISRQLEDLPIIDRTMPGMRPKPFPDMLHAAYTLAREEYDAEGPSVHIDDQLKALWAAHAVGSDFIWLFPRRIACDHPGTLLLRPLEAVALCGLYTTGRAKTLHARRQTYSSR